MRHEASPRDHPRVCGEHPRWLRGSIIARGSSPRVRGTPCPLVLQLQRTGIIPACAGNTAELLEELLNDGDHPRVCGEHPPQCRKPDDRPGSSPRVRGTLPVVAEHLLRHGIIPACAGNTTGSFPPAWCRWDHPRVCGEHLIPHLATSFGVGSSPRVRGTPEAFDAFMPYGGIIPACAGNTGRPHSPLAATGDHPRVCGEHVSPVIDGINEFRMVEGDHPRVCGEHLAGAAGDVLAQGSSPRVRGTQGAKVGRFAVVGIIPACAGNTSAGAMPVPSRTDHPRVCGEHPAMVCTTPAAPGSSPRVRGTLCRCSHHGENPGIIPACAGNTTSS